MTGPPSSEETDPSLPAEEGEALSFDLPPVEPPARRLGLWEALGFSALVLGLFFLVQVIALLGLGFLTFLREKDQDFQALTADIAQTGFYFSISIIASALVCATLLLLLIKLRSQSVREVLALSPVRLVTYPLLVLVLIGVEVLSYYMGVYFDRPPVPDYFVIAYLTAYSVPLLWVAVGVFAPLFEEVFFRGYLFTGLQGSRLGPWGACVFISLVWAALHVQYDLYDVTWIFLLGLLLGAVRIRSGSLYACVFLHAAVNLVALGGGAYHLSESGVRL